MTPEEKVAIEKAATEKAVQFGREHLADPTPQDGLVIVYQDTCPHCQQSLKNTGYPTHTTNGTPVKWLDATDGQGAAAFANIPGVTVGRNGYYFVGDTAIEAVPSIIRMEKGRAVEIIGMDAAIYPNRTWPSGETLNAIAPHGLDLVVARIHAQHPELLRGTTVPNASAPAAAARGR